MASKIFTFSALTAIIGSISNIIDAAGNPILFKGVPSWQSSDSTVFSPTVAADGLSCTGTVLKSGTVTITVTGDGVSESVTINALAGVVASFVVNFNPAPPPAPPST